MNIYEKMLAIAGEIKNIEKEIKVGVGNSGYKAVGEANVLAAVKPLETKYGVYGYPCHREIVDRQVIETQTKDGFAKLKWWLRVATTYRFVNVEKPEEFVEVIGYGDGMDDQDKAPGKAITYSDKYCLLKAFQCVTGDDPDQEPSEENFRKTQTYSQQRTQSQTPQNAQGLPPATPKQKDLIASLLIEKGMSLSQFGFPNLDVLTSKQASDVLDSLFKLPKPKREKEWNGTIVDEDVPF